MSPPDDWGYEPPARWVTRVDPHGRPDPRIMGDAGPWSMFVPAMWTAIADPTGTHPYPALPPQDSWPEGAAAYWAPLTHLLLYSFGWRSADGAESDRVVMGRGLTELLDAELNYLPQDTRLAFMMEVWGEDELRDFARWAISDGDLNDGDGRPLGWNTKAGTALAGGTDSLHLSTHWTAPLRPLDGSSLPVPATGTDAEADPPRAMLLIDAYAGWAAVLEAFGNSLPVPRSGRSWRVDVVVRRLGWLGQFRRSRDTGLWFAGGHLLHALAHE